MLTIRTCKVFSHALGEYLRQADYYSQGMKVEGRCFGRLCAKVLARDPLQSGAELFWSGEAEMAYLVQRLDLCRTRRALGDHERPDRLHVAAATLARSLDSA